MQYFWIWFGTQTYFSFNLWKLKTPTQTFTEFIKTIRALDLQYTEWENHSHQPGNTLSLLVNPLRDDMFRSRVWHLCDIYGCIPCCWLRRLVLKTTKSKHRVWQEQLSSYLHPLKRSGQVMFISFDFFTASSYRLVSNSFWEDNILTCSSPFGRNSGYRSYSWCVSAR